MTELKLLHAADLHLCSAFRALSTEDAEKRRRGQRALVYKIANIASAKGVDAVLLAGDVFDGDNPDEETITDFKRAFGSLSVPVIIAPGNHDPYTAHSVWNDTEFPENVHVFTRSQIEYITFPGINARVFGAAFTGMNCKPLLRDFEPPEKLEGKLDIMVLHGEMRDMNSQTNPISRDEIAASGMDYVALGHVHRRNELQHAGKTAYAYSGVTEGRGFDETGVKGVILAAVSDIGTAAEFIPLGGVRYEIFDIDVTGKDILSEILNAAEELTQNDCCRIILRGETENQIGLQELRKRLSGRFSLLQLRDETTVYRDVWELGGADTLTGVFIDKLNEKRNTAATQAEREIIELAAKFGVDAMENGGEI